MPKLRTIKDLKDIKGKTVIVRADLDVPVADGEVINNYRLVRLVPTIKELVKQEAKVVIMGHLGRPEEKEYQDEYSLMPTRFELGKLLAMHIKFAHIPQSRNSIRYMENGEVLMLENIRFHQEMQSKDPKVRAEFVTELAGLADYYVNNAFASYNVPDASAIELAEQVKKPVAGIQVEAEISKLSVLKESAVKPYVAVIGGAKLDSKIPVLRSLSEKADYILIGGAMAYTFLASQEIPVGDSKVQKDMIKEAKDIMKLAKKNGCELLLPVDHICGKAFEEGTDRIEVDNQAIPKGHIGLDIGERTLSNYLEIIKSAKTVLWNGPMGVFEWEEFSRGTEAIGEYIGLSAPKDTYKIAGGGDTVEAMNKLQINIKNYNHVSTGGGALLAFLASDTMPAIELLYK